jgi:hypothetical protein
MRLSTEQQKFTVDIAKLILFANTHCIELTFGEAYRTEDQQQLYFNGKTVEIIDGELGLAKVKRKSSTMNSNHLKRLAVDFNFFINGGLTYEKEAVKVLGEFWESLDEKNKWGGNYESFTDTPHFERRL